MGSDSSAFEETVALLKQALQRSPFRDHFLTWSDALLRSIKDLDSPDKVLEINKFRMCLENFAAAQSAEEVGQIIDAIAELLTFDLPAELRGKINACGEFKELTEQIDAHADALTPRYRGKHIPPAITQAGLMGYFEGHPQLHTWINGLSSEELAPLYEQWPPGDQSIDRAAEVLDVFVTVRSRREVDQIWYLLNHRIKRDAAESALEILHHVIEELDISEHVQSKETLAVWLHDIVKEMRSPELYDIIGVLTLQKLTALKQRIDTVRQQLIRQPKTWSIPEDHDVIDCRFGGGLDLQAKDFLRQEIEKLDPKTRLVLKLKLRRKWTLKKIAKEHRMKAQDVSKLIALTVADLRLRLEEHGY